MLAGPGHRSGDRNGAARGSTGGLCHVWPDSCGHPKAIKPSAGDGGMVDDIEGVGHHETDCIGTCSCCVDCCRELFGQFRGSRAPPSTSPPRRVRVLRRRWRLGRRILRRLWRIRRLRMGWRTLLLRIRPRLGRTGLGWPRLGRSARRVRRILNGRLNAWLQRRQSRIHLAGLTLGSTRFWRARCCAGSLE
jgi:hypothetical protein